MSKQFNKVRVSLTLDPEVHAYVATVAEKEERSVSQQINKILKEYIKSQDKGEK